MPRKYTKNKYISGGADKDSYLDKDVVIKIAPAPVKGLDALSPLAAMEPEYGVIVDNWVPRTGYCEIRGGMNPWCQGVGVGSTGVINTLMAYRPKSGNEKLFAVAGTSVWDVSNYGAPSEVSTTEYNPDSYADRCQFVNFTVGGGDSWLLFVNGGRYLYRYNGTSWTTVTSTIGNLTNISAFKRRIWVTVRGSSTVGYLNTDAVAGTFTTLSLGPFLTLGGRIVSICNWTLDGGTGPDDYVVFISDKGQAVVYKGTDPTNATAWAQVGVFTLPSPIGLRNNYSLGSDSLLITDQGVLPLSQSLPFDPASSRSAAITNRIQNAMVEAALLARNNFGWQLKTYTEQGFLILNVPTVEAQTSIQYVMNLITGAWCRFTGWNATCFETYNKSLYYAGVDGTVYLAYTGPTDKGASISYQLATAFNYFDEPGRIKNANMVRPFISANANIIPTIDIDQDFVSTIPTATATGLGGSSLWDTAIWDTSLWAGQTISVINWLSCSALGTALSINMAINLATSGTSDPNGFDYGEFDDMTFDGNGVITSSGQKIPILRVNTFEIALENGGPV